MPFTTPPTAPSTSDPSTFQSRADAMIAWFATHVSEVGAFESLLTVLAAGGAFAIPLTFSSTTADADPGAGAVRLDNFAAQTSAATMRVDLLGSDGIDYTADFAAMAAGTSAIKGRWRMMKVNDASKQLRGNFTAMASPAGYRNWTLTDVSGSSAAPFADGEAVVLFFQPTGDKGDAGASPTVGLTYDAQSTDVQLTAADFASSTRKLRVITGTNAVTQTIVALAGIANGDFVEFANKATRTATIDPDGAETIDGAATIKVHPGESCRIVKAAAGFYTTGLAPAGARIELGKLTAISAATADFANTLTSDFDEYIVVGRNLKPVTDAVDLYLRTSTDNGSSYDASGYDGALVRQVSGGAVASTSGAANQIQINGAALGNSTGESTSFTLTIVKPSAAGYCQVYWQANTMGTTTLPSMIVGAYTRMTAADVDAIRFLFSAGNIASGDIYVYGIKK